MTRTARTLLGIVLFTAISLVPAAAQEARQRWERMAQIRREKFDHVLPDAMRDNGIDMWITVVKEGLHDPLYEDLGRGYVGSIGCVLQEGETAAPSGVQNAFDKGREVREIIRRTIKPGGTAGDMLETLNDTIAAAGFEMMKQFNVVSGSDQTEVMIGCHSVGNLGHGIGPLIAAFNPLRMTFQIEPSNLFSIELFAWTAAPEWGGAKVRIPLEDDAVVTERGVEWLYPVNDRILLIR